MYRQIISGEAGPWAAPLRGALTVLSLPYRAAVAIRNRRFDRAVGVERAAVPVISVGNLTAGGTGKTPLVIDLAERLIARGHSPAIVARGYRAEDGAESDEERLIRRRCPAVAYVANADRVSAAREAVEKCHADVIILDDGFQHRRLARDLDLVLIDATCPFGYGRLLPRGLLREPVTALRRADAVVVTRCDQVAATDLARLLDRLHHLAPDATQLTCTHRVTGIAALDGTPQSKSLDGLRVVVCAAIGNPTSFRSTVERLGATIVAERWFRDHHPYSASDMVSLDATLRRTQADLLVSTEKDAVKLVDLAGDLAPRVSVVTIAIDFPHAHGTMLDSLLTRCLPAKP